MEEGKRVPSTFQRQRKSYVEQEDILQTLVCNKDFQTSFQCWLDATIASLDHQFEACANHLSDLQQSVAVEEGTYWNARTLSQHCNLVVDSRRLHRKGEEQSEHSSWTELIHLVGVLNKLQTKSSIPPKQVDFIARVQEELKNVTFQPWELRVVANALTTKLTDTLDTQNLVADLSSYQHAVDELSPDIDSAEQLLEASLESGDMAIAESVSYRQLDMYEHMLQLIMQQYPILRRKHAEAQELQRRRRWSMFRMANRDISSVVEARFRQAEACEQDLLRIKEQVENYNNDDINQRHRYETDRTESDRYLAANQEKQQGVWNRIHELFLELGTCQDELITLAAQRRKEVDRRLRVEEREAGRRSGHEAFLHVAEKHSQLLHDTIDNSTAARKLAKALNDYVLDGCETVTEKYDHQQHTLSEMLQLVQSHHFRRFTDFYLAAGRLLYRKERRMEQLNAKIDDNHVLLELASETLDPTAKKFADDKQSLTHVKQQLAEAIVELRDRVHDAEAQIAPTLRAMELREQSFVHPRNILTTVNLDRVERVLDYREALHPSQTLGERIMEEESVTLEKKKMEILSITEAKQSQKAKTPKPPETASVQTRKQYARLQQLLEKKLEMPLPAPDERTTPVKEDASPAVHFPSPTVVVDASAHKKVLPSPVVAGVASRPAPSRPADLATPLSKTPSEHPSKWKPYQACSAVSPLLSAGCTVTALYRYTARAPDELTFSKGDVIVCVGAAAEEGWYTGVCNQRAGLFPGNFVRVMTES